MTVTQTDRAAAPDRRRWVALALLCSAFFMTILDIAILTRANGQLAFGAYTWNQATGSFTPHGVNVLTLRGTQIEALTVFLTPEALRHFGLPEQLQP